MAVDPKTQNDTPEKVYKYGSPPPDGGSPSKSFAIKLVLISAVLSLAICLGLNYAFLKPVGMDLYNTNLKNMATLVDSINTKVTNNEKTYSSLSSTEFPALSKAFNDLKSSIKPETYATKTEVQAVQSSINNLANNSAVTNIQNDVNTVKTQVKAVADTNTLQDTKLTKLEADLKTVQEQLKLTQEQVKALQATPTPTTNPTATPTTTTSPTNVWLTSVKGQVTAYLKPYYSWGANSGNVVSMVVADGQTTTSTLKIDVKNTGVSSTAKDIQIMLGFGWLNSAGTPITAPNWITYGTNFNVTSMLSSATWVRQTDSYYSIYINQPTSGFFGSSLTVNPQETKSLTVTISIVGSATNPNPNGNVGTYYLYPMMEVLDYTQVTN